MTDRSGAACSISDCPNPAFGRGWCTKHYARWRNHGDPLHPVKERKRQGSECSEADCSAKPKVHGLCAKHAHRLERHGSTEEPRLRRFWSQVDKTGPNGCWLWTGSIAQKTGYGSFGNGRSGTRLAHRIAWEMTHGPIPVGLVMDHLCRVRRCVRPDHLQPITPRENIKRGDQGAFWGYVPEPIPVKPKPEKPTACTQCGSDKPVYKRTLCRPCYRRWLRDPNVERPSKRTTEQRFWEKVEKTETCWLWSASINRGTGHGQFGLRHGVMVQSHRYAYELANGSIPEGFDVHHTCHRRHCVRPEHLQALTRSENLALRKYRR